MSYAEIGRQTGVPVRPSKIFADDIRRVEHNNLPRSGSPRKTTEAKDRELSAIEGRFTPFFMFYSSLIEEG
jgi:hypothetical protein